MEGGRLSRPRHCSKGAQPVPKAVQCSGCRNKHNCQRRDSNLGPLTPLSDMLTTQPLRPAVNLPDLLNLMICHKTTSKLRKILLICKSAPRSNDLRLMCSSLSHVAKKQQRNCSNTFFTIIHNYKGVRMRIFWRQHLRHCVRIIAQQIPRPCT